MSNKSIRIRTNPGESKNIQLKVEQDFDFLEILSLKISQEEIYRSFCADYGVVVGRVTANNGFGVPNAKVSIFIPISSEDEKNDLLKEVYPFKTPIDKNSGGYRYNLLLTKSTCKLNKSVGTFPTKEEVLNNEIVLEVFEKYYKYTTRTNDSGDYMIFGVPLGQQTVHTDVDLSDIGMFSVRPYELISDGMPSKLFESSTQYKVSNDLDSLVQIKSQNKSIDVIPFWGDPEECELGITRVDFNTGVELIPKAIFMGSLFGEGANGSLNEKCKPHKNMGDHCNLKTSSGKIDILRLNEDINGNPINIEEFQVEGGDLIDDDGVFTFLLPMHTHRVVTDEFGNLVPSDDPEKGIPTKGRYRFKMNLTESPGAVGVRTGSLIFPSLGINYGGTTGTEQQLWTTNLGNYSTPDLDLDFHEMEWKQIYTISHMIKKYKWGYPRWSFIGLKGTNECENNPIPFNTAIQKFDILFWIMVFFLSLFVTILRFLIILSNLAFAIHFRVGFTILGTSYCIVGCKEIACFKPFAFIGFLIGCLELPCGDETYKLCFLCPEKACYCKQSSGCSGSCCHNWDGSCDFDSTCFGFAPVLPNESTCNSLNTLRKWECCVTYELAMERKVIRLSFFDAWLTGSAYLFGFNYRERGTKREFCGPGSTNSGGLNFQTSDPNNRCSNGNNCLVKYDVGLDEVVYCNKLQSTKIVNLGSIEVCEDVLYKIEKCIFDHNCLMDIFTLGPRQNKYVPTINNGSLLRVGTGGESGFDTIQRTDTQQPTTYKDPRVVFLYLLGTTSCNINGLFTSGRGCHSMELKDSSYQIIKEVSKIQNQVQTREFLTDPSDLNSAVDVFDTSQPFIIDFNEQVRYHPLSPDNISMNNNGNDRPNSYMVSNSPYFYFGLHQGRTALEKLRRDYFLFN